MATTSSRRKAPHVATAPAAKATAGAGCRTAGPCKPRTQVHDTRSTPRAWAPFPAVTPPVAGRHASTGADPAAGQHGRCRASRNAWTDGRPVPWLCRAPTLPNARVRTTPLLLLFCFLLPKADRQWAAMVCKWPIRHDSCPTAARSNVPSFAPTLTYCLIKCQCSANFLVYYILLITTLYLD